VRSAGNGAVRAPWRLWAVTVPAAAALLAAVMLGTAGFFFAGFSLGTMCTDFYDTMRTGYCAPLLHWMDAGAVGQGLCAITAVVLLVLAPRRPQERRAMAACALGLLVLTIALFAFTTYGGYRSYRLTNRRWSVGRSGHFAAPIRSSARPPQRGKRSR
jgi:hypothetical protein